MKSQTDDSDDDILDVDCDYVFMQEYREKRIQRKMIYEQRIHYIVTLFIAEMTQNDPSKKKATSTVPSSVSLLHSPQFGECVNSGGEGWYIREVWDHLCLKNLFDFETD